MAVAFQYLAACKGYSTSCWHSLGFESDQLLFDFWVCFAGCFVGERGIPIFSILKFI